MKVLLVRPDYPNGSNNNKYGNGKLHHKYFPIGILKMSTYFKKKGDTVDLVIGNKIPKFTPDTIYITSLFTYWRKFLEETIMFYRFIFPESEIVVGGVDASLNPKEIEKLNVKVHKGRFKEAEDVMPDYSYFEEEIDFQVIHTTRSCIRRCNFCGTYIIDGPEFTYKNTQEIEREIFKNKITFYDNNLLANPNIKHILNMLANKKVNGRVIRQVESKSGFDARLLTKDHEETIAMGGNEKDTLAFLLKKARFICPRIAWDNWLSEEQVVKKAIELLIKSGYERKNIVVFMIYNYDLPFSKMEYKRKQCANWGVQISDCRFRPLNAIYDNYNPRKSQTSNDYYIHSNWSDNLIKEFRRRVRGQNIMNRYLAKDRPLILDKFREYSVPEVVLKEYCQKNFWRENSLDVIHKPLDFKV